MQEKIQSMLDKQGIEIWSNACIYIVYIQSSLVECGESMATRGYIHCTGAMHDRVVDKSRAEAGRFASKAGLTAPICSNPDVHVHAFTLPLVESYRL